MRASILISVRDDPRLATCLESIFGGGLAGLESAAEVLVIENSDHPWMRDIVAAYPARYLWEAQKGMGWARALGLREARGEFIVFTDADCVVSAGWLSKLLEPFDDPTIGIVGGPVTKFRPRGFVEELQRGLVIGDQRALQYLPPIAPWPYVVTANAAYRADALRRAGGVDARFFSCGDVDMAWRIGQLGYAATIAADASVAHYCRRSVIGVFRQFSKYSQGHALLFSKFRDGRVCCWNPYPLIHFGASARAIASLVFKKNLRAERYEIGREAFGMIESAGLLFGAIIGSLRARVLYL
jgi:GT2 family glycosyltransferase